MTRQVCGSIIVALLTVLSCVTHAGAQSERVQVRAGVSSQTVYVGQAVGFTIEVQGTTNADQPTIDAVPGLDLRYAGGSDRSSSSVMIINGRRTERSSKAYVFQWAATASSAGRYTIPPVEVTAEGVKYTTRPVEVQFVEPPQTEEMLLDVSLDRESAYVGEPVRVTLDWYLTKTPENWRFTFPGEGSSFDLVSPASLESREGDLVQIDFMGRKVPARQQVIRDGDVSYSRVRIEQMLVPRETGALRVGAPTVSADLVMRQGFIRNETSYRLAKAEPFSLDVRELPSAGRPANFNGLIGAYSITTDASASRASVGDPVEVTLSVSGPLVESVRAPALHLQRDLASGFRVPEDLGLSQIEGGRKVWRFTIRPTSDGISEIPPIELPYFDTDSGSYEIARSEAIPLEVSASRRVTLTDAEGAPLPDGPGLELEETARGIAYNYEGDRVLVDQRFSLGAALASPVALAATAGSFGVWAFSAVFVTVRRRSGGDKLKSERKRAATIARRELGGAGSAGDVSAAVYAYLGRKAGRSASGLTPAECESIVGGGLGAEVRAFLEACDASVYAGSSASGGGAEVASLAERASALVDAMEKEVRA